MKNCFFLIPALCLSFGVLSGCGSVQGTGPAPNVAGDPSAGGQGAGGQGADSQEGAAPARTIDTVSAASKATNLYTNMRQADLFAAIGAYAGVCAVATVNGDGTPNIAIFVPGVAGENHLMFAWADNATKRNFLREKRAVLVYDVVNLGAETKEGRHQGAKAVLALEEDPAVLAELRAALPEAYQGYFDASVICRVLEIIPVG